MRKIYSTFDFRVPSRDIKGIYTGVYAMLMREFEAEILPPEFFRKVQQLEHESVENPFPEYTGNTFIFHMGMDFQAQLFKQNVLPTSLLSDEDNFTLDQTDFIQHGESDIEQTVNRFLFNHAPSNSHCLYVPKDFTSLDMTDKNSADLWLRILGVPTPHTLPLEVVLRTSPYRFAKHRKGSRSMQVHYFDDTTHPFEELGIDLNDWIVQEEIPVPTDYPTYFRVNCDFGEVTGVALLYDSKKGKVPTLADVKVVPLSFHGFESNLNIKDIERQALEAYEIDPEKRPVPGKMVEYSKAIATHCQAIGIHCVGIDFLLDSVRKKLFCIDINKSPGTMIYYMLERARGENPLFNQPYSKKLVPLRREAIHKYVRDPFAKLIGAE